MSATKIINVLKDDTFDEIFDLVRQTSAQEVIFVLPKKSKLFSAAQHFTALQSHAQETGKTLSVLCASAKVNDMAREHGFTVLTATKPKTSKAAAAQLTSQPIPQDKDVYDDSEDAYTEDVIIPSDEKIGIEQEEEDENEGMHIIDPDEEETDKKDKDLDSDDEDDESEEDDYRDDSDDDSGDADAGFTVTEPSQPQAVLARSTRNLDGVVSPHTEDERNIKIARRKEKPTSIDIKKSLQEEEIESVWQQAEPQSESVWKGVRSQKSLLKSFFTGSSRVKPRESHRTTRSSKRPAKKIFISVATMLALVLATVALYPASARISIKPQEKKLDTTLKVEVSDAVAAIDAAFNKLPGQQLSIERKVTLEFPATGEKAVAQKARGKLTVYNAYGTTPQTLISTTRFQSPDGLIFRSLTTVTVPGTRVENGTSIPGKVEVEVIADKVGEGYNINPVRFTVPAFKEKGDQARYEKFYAESTQPFSGGINGIAKVVTEADYTKAKDAVMEKLRNEVSTALDAESTGLTILNKTEIAIKSTESSAQPDQAAADFSLTMTGGVKTIGFKEEDMFELVRQYVSRAYNLAAIKDKTVVAYDGVQFQEAQNRLLVTVILGGMGYAPIDNKKIVADLLGKPEEAIRDYLKNLPGVASAKVVLSPRWSSKMPKDETRVMLDILY